MPAYVRSNQSQRTTHDARFHREGEPGVHGSTGPFRRAHGQAPPGNPWWSSAGISFRCSSKFRRKVALDTPKMRYISSDHSTSFVSGVPLPVADLGNLLSFFQPTLAPSQFLFGPLPLCNLVLELRVRISQFGGTFPRPAVPVRHGPLAGPLRPALRSGDVPNLAPSMETGCPPSSNSQSAKPVNPPRLPVSLSNDSVFTVRGLSLLPRPPP